MSNTLLKFIGMLLLLGSIGFVSVKSLLTGGVLFFVAETVTDVRPENLR